MGKLNLSPLCEH